MKQSTCKALKGACDAVITGGTPEEMAENCKNHAMKLMQAGDEAHLAAGAAMKALKPEEQMAWYEKFKSGFDALPEA